MKPTHWQPILHCGLVCDWWDWGYQRPSLCVMRTWRIYNITGQSCSVSWLVITCFASTPTRTSMTMRLWAKHTPSPSPLHTHTPHFHETDWLFSWVYSPHPPPPTNSSHLWPFSSSWVSPRLMISFLSPALQRRWNGFLLPKMNWLWG